MCSEAPRLQKDGPSPLATKEDHELSNVTQLCPRLGQDSFHRFPTPGRTPILEHSLVLPDHVLLPMHPPPQQLAGA